MHASKDSMWWEILKSFWILGESKQGLSEGSGSNPSSVNRHCPCERPVGPSSDAPKPVKSASKLQLMMHDDRYPGKNLVPQASPVFPTSCGTPSVKSPAGAWMRASWLVHWSELGTYLGWGKGRRRRRLRRALATGAWKWFLFDKVNRAMETVRSGFTNPQYHRFLFFYFQLKKCGDCAWTPTPYGTDASSSLIILFFFFFAKLVLDYSYLSVVV